MEMKEHIMATLESSEHKDNHGWITSYRLAKDAKISESTVMLRASELALEGKLERKKEVARNVMRILWRVKK